jgi:hypothetical protein
VISQFVRIPVPETLRLLTLGSFVLSLTACTATAWLYYAGWRVGIAGLLAVDGLLLAVVSRSGSRYQRRGGAGGGCRGGAPFPGGGGGGGGRGLITAPCPCDDALWSLAARMILTTKALSCCNQCTVYSVQCTVYRYSGHYALLDIAYIVLHRMHLNRRRQSAALSLAHPGSLTSAHLCSFRPRQEAVCISDSCCWS